MRLFRQTLVLLAAAMCMATTATAKDQMKKAYIYGVGTSLNDSVIYITEIQEVDSAWFSGKNNMLVSRENYSYQLRDHLGDKGEQHATCTVSFALNKKKATKKWTALYNKYAETKTSGKKAKKQKSGTHQYLVRLLPATEFKFQPVAPMEINEDAASEQPKAKKEKKAKKDRKNKPQGPPPAGGAPGGAPGGGFQPR